MKRRDEASGEEVAGRRVGNAAGRSETSAVSSACSCNGKSSECFFDGELYRATGHGGHCRNCADNTDGPNCERCLENYHRDPDGDRCRPCGCSAVGEPPPWSPPPRHFHTRCSVLTEIEASVLVCVFRLRVAAVRQQRRVHV